MCFFKNMAPHRFLRVLQNMAVVVGVSNPSSESLRARRALGGGVNLNPPPPARLDKIEAQRTNNIGILGVGHLTRLQH